MTGSKPGTHELPRPQVPTERVTSHRRLARLLVTIALLFGVVAVGLVPSAQATHNEKGCDGVLLEKYPLAWYDGEDEHKLGKVKLYYKDGWNCLVTKIADHIDEAHATARIYECPGTTECSANALEKDKDKGNFESYAGPVTVYAPENCIEIYAEIHRIENPGHGDFRWEGPYHCG